MKIIKVWDILSSWTPFDLEPTSTAPYRVQSIPSAGLWFAFEFALFFGITFLRIPRLSPSFTTLAVLLLGWNTVCYTAAVPSQVFGWLRFWGPSALGTSWSLTRVFTFGRAAKEGHISGVHKVRLLPFRCVSYTTSLTVVRQL